MKYTKEIEPYDFAKALHLDKSQEKRIKNAIEKAYNQEWHSDGPNIDQINHLVAPFINSQEEAFYAAVTIFSDVFGAMINSKLNS